MKYLILRKKNMPWWILSQNWTLPNFHTINSNVHIWSVWWIFSAIFGTSCRYIFLFDLFISFDLLQDSFWHQNLSMPELFLGIERCFRFLKYIFFITKYIYFKFQRQDHKLSLFGTLFVVQKGRKWLRLHLNNIKSENR